MSKKLIRIIRWLIVGTTFPFMGTAVLANEPTHNTFVELTHQGDVFFQQGHFQQAAKSWENNLASLMCTNNANPCIDLLTRLAAAYQALQKHSAMFQTLNQAVSLANMTDDRGHRALVRSQLSDAWLSIGASENLSLDAKALADAHAVAKEKTATEQPSLEKACSLAEPDYLKNACLLARDSVADARVANDPDVLARTLNSQGNVLVIMGLFPEAIDTYQESLQVAEQAGDSTLAVKVFLNGLNVDLMSGNLFKEEMITLLAQVWKQIEKLPNTYDKTSYLLSVGVFAFKVLEDDRLFKQEQQNARALLHKQNPADSSKMFPMQVSKKGESHACQYNQPQTQDDSLSEEIQQFAQDLLKEKGLAKQDRQRAVSQAYFAFQKAAQVAKHLQDDRTLSLAYGYLGQLYEQEQRYDEALRLTRQAIFFANQSHVSHSNQDQVSLISPVSHTLYRWYWQQGRILKAQGYLDQAIAAYRLASQNLKPIQNVLDLGYRIPQGLFEQVIRPVHYGLADLLLQKAEATHDEPAQQRILKEAINGVELVKVTELQDYFDECLLAVQSKTASILDNPKLQQELQHTAILYPIPLEDRLVVIVSVKGKIHMRSIPVTADKVNYTAWDLRLKLQTRPHNRFLFPARQLYNWLICPIETLLTENQVDTLVVVPDGKLRMIPFSTLHDGKHFLIEKYAMGLTPGLALVDPQRTPWDKDNKILLVGLSDAVQDYPALPNVKKEVQKIQDITKDRAVSDRIFNKEFSINNFHNQLRKNEYSIIHLATHGEFGADPEHTYILTYTEKMKMDKLQDVIGLGRFRDKPLELLTLSACKTAVGDDKAALGLAGVAIKAGARSAIATLWFVDDEATSVAMTDFYQQLLKKRGISKAKALQEVQKKLINIKRYWHPSYWGPFLLIGNWL